MTWKPRCYSCWLPTPATEAINAQLYDIQRANMKLFGYGAKAYMLSMIETAIQLTNGAVHGHEIQRIIDLGKDLLRFPIEPLPDVLEVLTELKQRGHRLLLLTKGDLFDQESKVARSGLGDFFDHVEIVSEKGRAHLPPPVHPPRPPARQLREDWQLAEIRYSAGGQAGLFGHPRPLPRQLDSRARAGRAAGGRGISGGGAAAGGAGAGGVKTSPPDPLSKKEGAPEMFLTGHLTPGPSPAERGAKLSGKRRKTSGSPLSAGEGGRGGEVTRQEAKPVPPLFWRGGQGVRRTR